MPHNPSDFDATAPTSSLPSSKRAAYDRAKYAVGQLIHHTLFDYRGVIVDVDPHFRVGAQMKAQDQRPKFQHDDSQPWYHVLIDGTANHAYVSEQNLEPDVEGGPIDHPEVITYFNTLSKDGYVTHPNKIH